MSARDSGALYVVACGSSVARNVGHLVTLAQHDGWDVCVITTPDGRKFLDVPALAAQTGHPVRSEFKHPGDPDVLPPPAAVVVAPATVNFVNKLAVGIADTLALGLVVEAHGQGLPVVLMPYTNTAMAAYPAFGESLVRLRSWGMSVLFGSDVVPLHPPRTGDRNLHTFPWGLALEATRAMIPTNGHGPQHGRQQDRQDGRQDGRRTDPARDSARDSV